MKEPEIVKDGLAEHGVEVTCAAVLLVLLVIFLFRLYSDWRDKRRKRLIKCRPHEQPLLMMLPGIHNIATTDRRVTFLCGAESFDGDRPSYNTRYCHSDDFQLVERLLKKVLPAGHSVRVPETIVAVSIARKHFVCGDAYTCFYPASGPSIRSHCTYKMLSARVQATYYVKRATSYLAGITIYPRLLIDVKSAGGLTADRKMIVRAMRKTDDYIPRPFSFAEKALETKWCHAHQKRLVIIRNKYGLDWKYYFNPTDGYFELVRCNECCAGGANLHLIRSHLRSILTWKLAIPPVTEIAPPPPYVQIDGPPPSYTSMIFDEVSTDV